jgi:hypothetical protein
MKLALALLAGFAIGFAAHRQPTKLIYSGSNWVLSGIPMPPCPDDYKRSVEIPERDESDSLAVTCSVRK